MEGLGTGGTQRNKLTGEPAYHLTIVPQHRHHRNSAFPLARQRSGKLLPRGWLLERGLRRELAVDGLLVFHGVALNDQAARDALGVQTRVQ